jgi:hypothetical protein
LAEKVSLTPQCAYDFLIGYRSMIKTSVYAPNVVDPSANASDPTISQDYKTSA